MQQESTRYNESRTNEVSMQLPKKISPQKLLFYSSSKNSETGSQGRSLRHRYMTENEIGKSGGVMHMSYNLNLKNDSNNNNFQVSEINTNIDYNNNYTNRNKSTPNEFHYKHNPYLSTNRRMITVKEVRSHSLKNRKPVIQQYIKQSSIKNPMQRFKPSNLQVSTHPEVQILKSKSLSNSNQNPQSEIIIEETLFQLPDNPEALLSSAISTFNLKEYNKTINIIERIIEKNPSFNQLMYVMICQCYAYKNMWQEAIDKIDLGIKCFNGWYEGYLEKSEIYAKMGNFDQQIKFLKKALKFGKDTFECSMKLGECYEKLCEDDFALKVYEEMCSKYGREERVGKVLLKKGRLEKKQEKYREYISTLIKYTKTTVEFDESEINYEIAYSYYKLNDQSNSVMYLEEVLLEKNEKYSTTALVLLTIIHIKKRDFYEAFHILQRKEHIYVNEEEIETYFKFCEGVLFLMKRKFESGLEKLREIEWKNLELAENENQQIKFKSANNQMNEFEEEVYKIYDFYLSYAYFCLGNTNHCISLYQKILSNPNCPAHSRSSTQFNLSLCLGLHNFRKLNIPQSRYHFTQAIHIYPDKPEGYLYLTVVLLAEYLENPNTALFSTIIQNLERCLYNLRELSNNYASYAYYIKSALSAYTKDWDNAINEIDEAIERAEDNNDRSFYLRGLILACCQNFKQAIGEINIALSINEKIGKYYLLRARCEQIEGDGNKAFIDLQEYIALCPEDTEIHKFAGHLLFENGAFEDAIQAYKNGEILQIAKNYDVFLTKSKTYFLLGEFENCAIDMKIVNDLNEQAGEKDEEIWFDYLMVKIVDKFFCYVGMTSKEMDKKELKTKLNGLLEEVYILEREGSDNGLGKIFKKVEICMLLGMFMFYAEMYEESAKQFEEAILFKEKLFVSEGQDELEEELKEKDFFNSQMSYNMAIAYLMISDTGSAINCLDQCVIEPESKIMMKMSELINIIKNVKTMKGNKKMKIEVFSQKNKMSKLLGDVIIKLSEEVYLSLKLCVPFPKVEPPEINPSFEESILKEISIEEIEKKPEAPWILREENSIKFTEKIENFSRLEINNSELSKHKEMRGESEEERPREESEINLSKYQEDQESCEDIRHKLKLDDSVERKLQGIMNKKG